jgi:hypothetical protein
MNTKVINVSSKKFEANPGYYLEAVDGGARVTIRRGKGLSHVLKTKDDTLMSKEKFFAKIDESLEQVKRGEVITVNSREELHELFNSL